MMIRKHVILSSAIGMIVIIVAGCSILEKVGLNIGGSSGPNRTRGEWYPVYWGGEQVGEGKFELEILQFNDGTQQPILTITEDIMYRGGNYIFTFVLAETITRLEVKRYNPEKEVYLPGDSYRIEVDDNILTRVRYGKDGQEIVETREITDQRKLEYTEDLFKNLGSRMRSRYGYYMYSGRDFEEVEKMKSFGYDLLNYDQI